MPESTLWATFFDVPAALDQLLCVDVENVVEFGCGYGHFTIPAAKRACGRVFAFDIEPAMVEGTRRASLEAGCSNVVVSERDFMAFGTGLEGASSDYVMAFNILHIEQPQVWLQEAARVLKPHGKLALMHWKHDPATPRGPSLSIRPTMDQCRQWAESVGFEFESGSDLNGCPWHWGLLLRPAEKFFPRSGRGHESRLRWTRDLVHYRQPSGLVTSSTTTGDGQFIPADRLSPQPQARMYFELHRRHPRLRLLVKRASGAGTICRWRRELRSDATRGGSRQNAPAFFGVM